MSTWVNYKGLQVPSPDPSGDAGLNLKNNFKTLADRGISDTATLGAVAFVGGTIAVPVLKEDSANFFWDDANNRLGIGTNSPDTALDVRGAITVGTPAGTVSSPDTGQGVLFIKDNSGVLELRIKFPNGIEKVLANDT